MGKISMNENEVNGLAKFIAELVFNDKETVLEALQNNDKQMLTDEIYYAIQECEPENAE